MSAHVHLVSFSVLLLDNALDIMFDFVHANHIFQFLLEGCLKLILRLWHLVFYKEIHSFLLLLALLRSFVRPRCLWCRFWKSLLFLFFFISFRTRECHFFFLDFSLASIALVALLASVTLLASLAAIALTTLAPASQWCFFFFCSIYRYLGKSCACVAFCRKFQNRSWCFLDLYFGWFGIPFWKEVLWWVYILSILVIVDQLNFSLWILNRAKSSSTSFLPRRTKFRYACEGRCLWFVHFDHP